MPLKQPTDLVRKIEKSGYYPALVADVLDIALADEPVLAHLVHGETTFDLDTIRRHLSVVVLTAGRRLHDRETSRGAPRAVRDVAPQSGNASGPRSLSSRASPEASSAGSHEYG